jgi:O-phosphoseryl-tRNA(Cys) synthetase
MEILDFMASYQEERWNGTIQFDLKTDHHISAVVTSRETSFYISLATYGSNWSIYVDNYHFGDRVGNLGYNLERWSRHVQNPVDLRIIAYAVEKIFNHQ